MADGLRRFPKYQGRWFTDVLAKRQCHALKPWHCEFLLSGSSMAKCLRRSRKFSQLRPREPMGLRQSRKVLAPLPRIGWIIKRESRGSHRILSSLGWPDIVFAFHDLEETGPRMLARIGKRNWFNTGRCLILIRRTTQRSCSIADLIQESSRAFYGRFAVVGRRKAKTCSKP
jgi:predicted RNA binding protein YcfA (HicA-like mRNA interferase family)